MRGKLSDVLKIEDKVLNRKMPWSFKLIPGFTGRCLEAK